MQSILYCVQSITYIPKKSHICQFTCSIMLARGTLRGIFRSARPPAQLYRNQIRLASEDQPKRKPGSSPRLLAGLAGAALLFVVCENPSSSPHFPSCPPYSQKRLTASVFLPFISFIPRLRTLYLCLVLFSLTFH